MRCRTWQEVAARISDMTVRGAPAIGVTAAGGLALAAAAAAAASPADPDAFRAALEQAASGLLATRPTAVNLRWAVDEMRLVWSGLRRASGGLRGPAARPRSVDPAGRHRALPAHRRARVRRSSTPATPSSRTATPAPWPRPATAPPWASCARPSRGTAASPSSSTRRGPGLQGARLTAWELGVEGIPYRLISDSMAGHFIQRGAVDGVVVGADRIAANGDTANKIGTYTVSVLAKEHGVPFYVAAPLSTVDLAPGWRRRHPHRGARRGRGHIVPRLPGRARRRARVSPGLRRDAGRQHRRHRHRGRRAARAVRTVAGGSVRHWGVRVMSADRPAAGAAPDAPLRAYHHGRRPGHAALSAHGTHVQAYGAHPQPAGHGAPAEPSAPARHPRGRRQPALPPGQDPRVLRRRLRLRRRPALQPRAGAARYGGRRRRVPRVPRRRHLRRGQRRRAHRHRPHRPSWPLTGVAAASLPWPSSRSTTRRCTASSSTTPSAGSRASRRNPPSADALSALCNCGIYAFEPAIFDYVPADVFVDWAKDVFPALLAADVPFYCWRLRGLLERRRQHRAVQAAATSTRCSAASSSTCRGGRSSPACGSVRGRRSTRACASRRRCSSARAVSSSPRPSSSAR